MRKGKKVKARKKREIARVARANKRKIGTKIKVRDLLREKYTFFDVNDTLETVTGTFVKRHISSAPVVMEGKYVGMISDKSIIRKFVPKKFAGIWVTEVPAPVEKIRRMPIEKLTEKSSAVLKPDQSVESILPLVIEKRIDCLPVVEDGNLIGIIRGVDVIMVLQRYFATYEHERLSEKPPRERVMMETVLDRILKLVEKEGEIRASEIASQLNITTQAVEKMGSYLEKHGLIKIRRTLWGQFFIRIERG